MFDISASRLALQQTLEEALTWIDEVLEGIYLERLGSLSDKGLEDARRDIERKRTRASSALINVGFLGGFSSGKSFLLSGLQRRLALRRLPVGDQYIGLLPSAPTPTTACPATVVPVKDSYGERGFLRARFTDSDEWEDIGDSLLPLMVASYAMQSAALTTGRREQDWGREVAEIEILLSEFDLPAKLYDLPGHGSANSIHDNIVRDKMVEADSYIYVASATRTLDASDLDLIAFLYKHYKVVSEKRVVWVVTAIDRAMELGLDGRPSWEATVARNNEYLRENFQLANGQPDMGFIGEGFIAVSPALEAQGMLALETDADKANGQRLVSQSQMDELRNALKRIIERDTGHRHIAQVANEVRAVFSPHHELVETVLATARLPVDELNTKSADLRQRLLALDAATTAITSAMEESLRQRVRKVERRFSDKPTLASSLQSALKKTIQESDVRRDKVRNQLEVAKTHSINEWMSTAGGPDSLWDTEFTEFKHEVLTTLRATIQQAQSSGAIGSAKPTTMKQLTVVKTDRSRNEVNDIVQKAAGLAGGISAVAGGVTAALGILSGGLLFIPAGITVGAVLLYGAVSYNKKKQSSLDLERQEWFKHLDEVADEIKTRQLAHMLSEGSVILARARELLNESRKQLAQGMFSIEERLNNPDTESLQTLIRNLAPLDERGKNILAELDKLT